MDVRLDRRLKRRVVSNQHCTNFNDIDEYDADYRSFLNTLSGLVDSSDENANPKLQDSRCHWSDQKVDPHYNLFFHHLIQDGKSFKLQLPSLNGIKVCVKYEEEQRSTPKTPNPPSTRILRSAKHISNHGVNQNSSTKPRTCFVPAATHRSRSLSQSQSDFDSDLIDEDYKIFLAGLNYDNDQRLLHVLVEGRSLVYDDDESSTDSEVVVMDTDPCTPTHTSFGSKYLRPTMDVDSGKCIQSPGICKSSNFRERLITVLRRPYDRKEYDFFLHEVSRHRAHVRHRELRSGVLRAYPLKSCGKSYLNLYEELANRIQAVQYDRSRTLNVLRGFFYWLQNLSHEDAFQPWMDPSCLDVLPRP